MWNYGNIRLLFCKERGGLDRKLQWTSEFTGEARNYVEVLGRLRSPLLGGGEGKAGSMGDVGPLDRQAQRSLRAKKSRTL